MVRFVPLAVVASLIASSSTAWAGGTSFVTTWKDPDAQALDLKGQKIITVVMSPEESTRRGAEHILAQELTKRGAQGVPSYTLIPSSEIKDEAKVKAKFEESGAVCAVVMRVVL